MTAVAACRTCGTEPLEHARFCHGCGSPAEEGDTRAEYKQVTVLFADVVHSMDIASAVGAERLREIMTELVDRSANVVQRYRGTVDKFTGDGIMAVFGAPPGKTNRNDGPVHNPVSVAPTAIRSESARDPMQARRCRVAMTHRS
jgi:class 3 adenylate cyclase